MFLGLLSQSNYLVALPILTGDSREIEEEVAKEWEHKLLQNTMDKELNELNKRLEQKEVYFMWYYNYFYCHDTVIISTENVSMSTLFNLVW